MIHYQTKFLDWIPLIAIIEIGERNVVSKQEFQISEEKFQKTVQSIKEAEVSRGINTLQGQEAVTLSRMIFLASGSMSSKWSVTNLLRIRTEDIRTKWLLFVSNGHVQPEVLGIPREFDGNSKGVWWEDEEERDKEVRRKEVKDKEGERKQLE